jgi:transcriptional regulator with XRE-family HTH domain
MVAKIIGANPTSILNWERGRSEPVLRFIPKILDFLGYDPRPRSESLADRIRAAREAQGLSQKILAERLGVDPSTVQKWERLGFNPHPRLFAKLVSLVSLQDPTGEMTLGERLREWRLRKGLTQGELAATLGVGQETISKWELGKKEPAKAQLAKLIALLR